PPVISIPLVAGSVLVGGTGTADGTVEVFIERVGFGTAIVGPGGSWSRAVPALTAGSSVNAQQTVAGVTSAFSATVTVVGLPPAPLVDDPIVAGSTSVSGAGTIGASVGVVVDGAAIGSVLVGLDGGWIVPLALPLSAGQVVEAHQTLGEVTGPLSPAVVVLAPPPPPALDSPRR